MKNLTKIIFTLLVLLSFSSIAQVYVRGYTKSNGTYVQPHYRSSPNSTPIDNYSYPGNTNPFTGKVATGDPDTYLKNYYNKNSKINSGNSSSTNYTVEDLKVELEGVSQQYNSNLINSQNSSLTFFEGLPNIALTSPTSYKTYYAKQDTWIRKGPGMKYHTLCRASFMQDIEIIDKYSNGWSKISFNYMTHNFDFVRKIGYIPTNRITSKAF